MRWFYITGCDSGFGRQLVHLLSDMGHGVFAGCFLEQSLDQVKGEVKKPDSVIPVQVDVTDEESVKAAAGVIREKLGGAEAKLDGVVNNAGLLVTPGPLEWTPISSYQKMLNVNVIGIAAVTKSVLPMIRKAQGRIVNVASIAGRFGIPTQPAYCASKYAVEGLSDVLRRDMSDWGVTVHIIEPGVFPQTDLYDTADSGVRKMWNDCSDEVKTDYGEHMVSNILKGLNSTLKDMGEKVNKDKSMVPRAMVHALTSDKPRYRYRVGADSKYAITLLSWLPESWQDGVCLRELPGIPRQPPKAAPADGKALATNRYEKSQAPLTLSGAMLAGSALSFLAGRLSKRSRL